MVCLPISLKEFASLLETFMDIMAHKTDHKAIKYAYPKSTPCIFAARTYTSQSINSTAEATNSGGHQ